MSQNIEEQIRIIKACTGFDTEIIDCKPSGDRTVIIVSTSPEQGSKKFQVSIEVPSLYGTYSRHCLLEEEMMRTSRILVNGLLTMHNNDDQKEKECT